MKKNPYICIKHTVSNILKFTTMKKILAIFAACALMASCQFWHETFSSPEDCTVWYLEQIAEAEEDGDTEKVEELTKDYDEWLNGLSEEDQLAAAAGALKWASEHTDLL